MVKLYNGKASVLTAGSGEENMVFFAGHQVRSPAQLGLKTPELPDGFQQVVFKGQMREGHLGLWDQLVHNSLNG